VRLYTGPDGESHFEDVTVALTPVDFAPPALPLDLSTWQPAERVGFVHGRPGLVWRTAPYTSSAVLRVHAYRSASVLPARATDISAAAVSSVRIKRAASWSGMARPCAQAMSNAASPRARRVDARSSA